MKHDPTKPVIFPAVVLIDNRENLPYSFRGLTADAKDGGGPLIVELRGATLKSGDYSIWPHQDILAVERKSAADLFGTLGQGRDRFERELERLSGYQFAAVVVEAEMSELIHRPPEFSQLTAKTVHRSVIAWQQRFPRIHWWFAADRRFAEITTFRILERFHKDWSDPAHGPHIFVRNECKDCKAIFDSSCPMVTSGFGDRFAAFGVATDAAMAESQRFTERLKVAGWKTGDDGMRCPDCQKMNPA